MQRHPSMFRRGLLIWSLTLVASPVSAALAQGQPPGPWTDDRANALVRIEAPGSNVRPDVATGFIVNGHGGKQYVATVTHGLLPGKNDYQNPDNCEALPAKTRLLQANTGGPELRPDCAYHIGKDVSLIALYPRASPLPALSFLACDLVASDDVYLGGFALGLDRITMVGKVRGNGSQGTIITDSLTAGGLSGGPYLTADGDVAGIHQGVLRDSDGKESPGYATILPVLAMRTKLEALLPQIKTQDECPEPATSLMEKQTFQAELAVFEKEWEDRLAGLLDVKPGDNPASTLEQRIETVEKVINALREEIDWGLYPFERVQIPIVAVQYRRLVAGSSPTLPLQLTVTAVANPPDPKQKQTIYAYPDDEIQIVPGKSGKWELPLRSALVELALENQIEIQHVRLDLAYQGSSDLLASTSFTLSKPVEPW